jgi:DNA-binding transcriptional LysR family regulator
VSLVSKGMGIALVPRALTESGIAGVRFLPIPQSRFVSDVYCIWNERQMPAVLPALLEAFSARPVVI